MFSGFLNHLVLNSKKYENIQYSDQGWEFAHSLIAHSLIWSDRSFVMSDCEQFAQIAQDKWATVRESLRSLMSKEPLWMNRSGRSRQKSDPERFALVTHNKREN